VWTVAFAAALASASTSAPPVRRLAILPSIVQGSSGGAEVPRLFEELARSADVRVGIELVSYNELFIDGAEPIAANILACGSVMPCIGRALRTARIELCMRAIVNFAVSPPLVSLTLIDSAGEKIVAESIVEAGASRLETELAGAAGAMLEGAGHPRGARLSIEPQPPDAKITVHACSDDQCTEGQEYFADPKHPSSYLVPAGRYQIAGTREGHEPAAVRADAELGRSARVSLILQPLDLDEDRSLLESPWFWLIAGGAVIAAGTVVLFATDPFAKNDPSATCLCIVTPTTPCPPCP
jgi:hypothetical protein